MIRFAQAPDGVRIAWTAAGDGAPALLIHGFGSSGRENWAQTGWTGQLAGAGLQVLAVDCRGHGASDKPHHVAGYRHDEMADDIVAVLGDAGVRQAHVIGYSMGSFIALHLAAKRPDLIGRLVIGGIGEVYLDEIDPVADAAERGRVADAMATADATSIADPALAGFQRYANQPGQDPLALAACWRAPSRNLSPAALARIRCPALVVAGERDHLGSPGPLAAALGDGRALVVDGADHRSAVADPRFRDAALAFLG